MSLYHFGRGLITAVDAAFGQYVTASLQDTPYSAVDDLLYMGCNGGALRNVAQIIVRGNRIVGFTPISGRRMPIKDDRSVFAQDEEGKPQLRNEFSGPDAINFDERFEQTGTANFVTNSDYGKLNDKTAMRRGFVVNDIRYLVGRGKRTPLKDSLGNPTGFDVIDVPTADGYFGGLLKVFDPRGINPYQILNGAGLALAYTLADRCIFDPIVEGPVRAMIEFGKETGNKALAEMSMDGFMESEFNLISEGVNDLRGLPKLREILG